MTRITLATALVALLLAAVPAAAQAPLGRTTTGPVIEGYGPVFDVPFVEVETDTNMEYRVVFDVAESTETPGDQNRYIASVARFLNMQARAGVPLERMNLAIVLHGPAAKDALRPEEFLERYGTDNQNHGLLKALAGAGVQIYMCGQSAMSRGLHDDDLIPEVQMGLSAMTVMAMLKKDGYVEIN